MAEREAREQRVRAEEEQRRRDDAVGPTTVRHHADARPPVVEDEAGLLASLAMALREEGYAVDTAMDLVLAAAALFLASRFGDYITGEVIHVDGGFKMS